MRTALGTDELSSVGLSVGPQIVAAVGAHKDTKISMVQIMYFMC